MKLKTFLMYIVCIFTFNFNLSSFEYKTKKITLYDREGIVLISKQYLGVPYKSGGTTPAGFDCSGFTMFVYQKAGYKLPRSTKAQYDYLKPIKVPKKGDLVFFDIDGNGISHVGIYLGEFKFIHAPSTGKRVEIVDLRNQYWKKRYRGSRTYFED
jgi:D-gamma-glutamyl-meso-diaminopimelic acid endopeptidase CwlS/peptidoglycan endopeptidase LytE